MLTSLSCGARIEKGVPPLPSLWAHAHMGDDHDDDVNYDYDADDDERTRFARSVPRSLEASQARGVNQN